MIRHCVLLSWKPEATDEQITAVIDALRDLPGEIPAIKNYEFGQDLGAADGNASLAVIADFDDQEGWRAYAEDSTHLEVLAKYIRPILADRAACQFEL